MIIREFKYFTMQYKVKILLSLAILMFHFGRSENIKKVKVRKIVIETEIPQDAYKTGFGAQESKFVLESVPFDYIEMYPTFDVHNETIVNNKIRWVLYADRPLMIRSSLLTGNVLLVNPGDSISISYKNNIRTCSGTGAEAFELQRDIEKIQMQTFTRPTKSYLHLTSVADFFNWKKYLDSQVFLINPLFDSYKAKIDPLIFYLIKTFAIKYIEFQRAESFMALFGMVNNSQPISRTALTAIWDSTLNNKWSKWLRKEGDNHGDIWYFYQFNRLQVFRKFGYNVLADSINTKNKRRIQYYNSLKENYNGLLRERLLQYTLADDILKKVGYNSPLTKSYLNDYYSQSTFPEYKQWMKDFEKKASKLYNFESQTISNMAPNFQLEDATGKLVTKNELKGKVALLDFWFTGCEGCKNMVPTLKKVEDAFKNDPNIVFVNISTDEDKNRWLKSIQTEKYTTGKGINLYTGGKGANHPVLEDYNISSFPELYLINELGEIQFPVPDPRKDSGVALIELLSKKRAELNDGPYVIYKEDSVLVSYVNSMNGIPTAKTEMSKFKKDEPLIINISTDHYPKTVSVKLKPQLQNEPSAFAKPSKQFVLSDIEGNFDALRELLQSNKIIDENYDWIFGDGHLVFVGDMFDRGKQVTECLWLIYSLEEKAKKAGGYVHFILGNHEILNLSNDQRYLREKYKETATLLDEKYAKLYGINSELGRWLGTKNIIEKVGDVLYTHAGISREVNLLPLSLEKINDLIRPFYAERDRFKNKNTIPELRVLFNSRLSPFWYRGYYKGDEVATVIDSSLQKFEVAHIITGHTIVSDTVSVHFNGKILNVDTHHARDESEALLIVGPNYYRVDRLGNKKLIMKANPQLYTKSSE
jgi:cytochrome oxidase Cu insertion factor (SCO1/SenC/PrrC family)